MNGLDSGITVENISDSGNVMTFDVVMDDDVQEGLRNLTTIEGSIDELKSRNVIRRRNAAISLEEVADERATGPLTAALSDEDVEVRKHAVNALRRVIGFASWGARHNDPKIEEEGEKLCSRLKESGAIGELSRLAALGDAEISPPAIEALGPMLFCMSDEEKGSAMLNRESIPGSGPAEVRAARLRVLADMRDPEAEDVFVDALRSDEREVITSAADGAAKIRSAKAIPRLVETANSESMDEDTRTATLDALRQIEDPSAAAGILNLLKAPSFPVRWAAACALQGMRSKDALDALIAAMADPDINAGAARHGDIRRAIKGALVGIGQEAVSEMLQLLQDENAPLDAKPFVAGGLGDIGEPSAVAPMVALALSLDPEREEWNQRVEVDHAVLNKLITLRSQLAINAKRIVERKPLKENEKDYAEAKAELGKLTAKGIAWLSSGDPKRRMDGIEMIKQTITGTAPAELYAMLNDKNPDVRKSAASAFADIRDPGSVEPLISLLDDEYWTVRYYAAQAIGRMKAAESVQALIDRMGREEDRRVYIAIVEALGQIGTPETTGAMLSALEGWVYEARCGAANRLGRCKGDDVVDALIRALPDEGFGKIIKVRWACVSGPRMRVWAVRSLGRIGDQRATAAIEPYLTSNDLSCRWSAAVALARLGGVRMDGVPRGWLPLVVGKYIEETTGKELLEFVPREYMRR
jgi:HEAT repeat protein